MVDTKKVVDTAKVGVAALTTLAALIAELSRNEAVSNALKSVGPRLQGALRSRDRGVRLLGQLEAVRGYAEAARAEHPEQAGDWESRIDASLRRAELVIAGQKGGARKRSLDALEAQVEVIFAEMLAGEGVTVAGAKPRTRLFGRKVR